VERWLAVTLRGRMTQAALERFRELLGLRARGRLTDTEDMRFGSRDLPVAPPSRAALDLWRHGDTLWEARLTYAQEPPPPDLVERIRSAIMRAAAEAGLSVERVREPPDRRL
jgi:hypothetical protein